MNFASILRAQLSYDSFTENDLKTTFRDKPPSAILSGLSRSLRSKEIIKLKRGIYVFGDSLRRAPISQFSIANKMAIPSYVSFESALSFYGLIPEAVYAITSASPRRKEKLFKTHLGDFSFEYIPCQPFFMGVENQKQQSAILMANPIKALFDYVYRKRKSYRRLEELEGDLRIDLDELKHAIIGLSYRELEVLALSYRKKTAGCLFELLAREYL
jgi:hypothetical protein